MLSTKRWLASFLPSTPGMAYPAIVFKIERTIDPEEGAWVV